MRSNIPPLKTPYEYIGLGNISALLVWPILLLLFVGLFEYLLYRFNEQHFLLVELLLIALSVLEIIVFISYSRLLYDALSPLQGALWGNPDEFDCWYIETRKKIFTLQTSRSIIFVLVVTAAGMTTVTTLGLPFKSEIVNTVCWILFLGVMIICSHMAYSLTELLLLLREISNRKILVPFGTTLSVESSSLHGYYVNGSILVAVAYGIVVVAIWKGPYGFVPLMIVWLSALALSIARLVDRPNS